MLSFVNHLHAHHCPTYEFYRGEKVPCFEKVERYDYVIEALKANGHEVSFATIQRLQIVIKKLAGERVIQVMFTHVIAIYTIENPNWGDRLGPCGFQGFLCLGKAGLHTAAQNTDRDGEYWGRQEPEGGRFY